jgi:hypothetical protein
MGGGKVWREFEDKLIEVRGNLLLTWPHYTDLHTSAGIQPNTYFKKGKLPEESKLTYKTKNSEKTSHSFYTKKLQNTKCLFQEHFELFFNKESVKGRRT